jgi:hypothetical protein
MLSVPAHALHPGDRHISRKVTIFDWQCNVDGGEETLEPPVKGANLNARQKELISLSADSYDITTPKFGQLQVNMGFVQVRAYFL